MARKVFVDVIVRENKDGRKRPMSLVFEDGKSYVIDRLIQVKRCAAMKVGGTGIRYTVSISGILCDRPLDSGKKMRRDEGRRHRYPLYGINIGQRNLSF